MKKLIALAAIAATVGLTACASDRHDKGGRDGEHRHGAGKGFHGEHKQGRDGLPRGFDRLNLSDAQKQQIQTILDNNRSQAAQNQEARRAEFEQQRAAEQALVSGATFNENAARQMIAGQQQRHADMALQQMRVRHQLFQVLTPEQRQQLQQMQQERGSRGNKGERGERRGQAAQPQQ